MQTLGYVPARWEGERRTWENEQDRRHARFPSCSCPQRPSQPAQEPGLESMRWGGEEGTADWSTVMSNTSPGCSHASFSRSRPGNRHPAHPCATTSKLVQFPLFHSGLWNRFPDTQHHNLIFVLEDNGCYETRLPCHNKASGEFPLEEGMAPHSSILAWKSHGQRSLADSMGSQKSQTWLSNYTAATKVSESYFPFM